MHKSSIVSLFNSDKEGEMDNYQTRPTRRTVMQGIGAAALEVLMGMSSVDSPDEYRARDAANEIGKAYSLFDCDYTKEELDRYLPAVRDAVETPPDVELTLRDEPVYCSDFDKMDAEWDQKPGFKYALEARYPGRSNRDASEELVWNLDQLSLLKDGFDGEIAYREGNRYVFRE